MPSRWTVAKTCPHSSIPGLTYSADPDGWQHTVAEDGRLCGASGPQQPSWRGSIFCVLAVLTNSTDIWSLRATDTRSRLRTDWMPRIRLATRYGIPSRTDQARATVPIRVACCDRKGRRDECAKLHRAEKSAFLVHDLSKGGNYRRLSFPDQTKRHVARRGSDAHRGTAA
jgi:hypothetical protein